MVATITQKQILSTSRVLIVDDSITSRLILSKICTNHGFSHIREAVNGEEGLAVAGQWNPDIIFLDVNMPLINGIDVCKALRQLQNDSVIIMHTAMSGPDFKTNAFDAGVTDFITQPFDGREVIARVLAHLERRRYKQRLESDSHRLTGELKEAAMLQSILTPDARILDSLRNDKIIDIAYYYHPSTELGGDYVAVIPILPHQTALVVLDVSGHGVTAALYTFVIHTLLQEAFTATQDPAQVLNTLNGKLNPLLLNGKFATIFLGIVDSQQQTLKFSATGSPRPILYSGKDFHLLDSSAVPLGAQRTSHYVTHERAFLAGDMLCLYSDAFIETRAKNGEFLSENQLIQMLGNPHESSANTTLKTLLSRFFIECGNNPPDDLTLLICTR